MIEELRIKDLGVIKDSTLQLGPGFTAITGETGAGKTMVVTALGLLMGERADAAAVRTGALQARVGGLIRTDSARVSAMVEDLGGEVEDGDLTLTRSVSAEGRSRATIGGTAAPVGALNKLATQLFAVHGQSEQLRLRSSAAQREMLDRFGGEQLQRLREQYSEVFATRHALADQLSEIVSSRAERRREAEQLRAEIDEISAVDPQPEEEQELKQRIDRLQNLGALVTATSVALRALHADNDGPYTNDVSQLINEALHEVQRAAENDDRLDPIVDTLTELSVGVDEVTRALSHYVQDLDQDSPDQLSSANDRLALLNSLFRRFGDDSHAVIAYAQQGVQRLLELDNDDSTSALLGAQLDELTQREDDLAARLTEARTEAAALLCSQVSYELQQLAMPDALLHIAVEPIEHGPSGADDIQLLLQPHAGAAPRHISKGASGGELSRVMLALEVVVAASDPVPTFVFDEVDSGVGGAAAIEIGRRLARLARTSQVIVVTHLAQVAAFAELHLQVVKDSAGRFTESSCVLLDEQTRVSEMARLLSGLVDSDSGSAHAQELLDLGAAERMSN